MSGSTPYNSMIPLRALKNKGKREKKEVKGA